MSVFDSSWREALAREAKALGVELTEAHTSALASFADRLVEWGSRINLSSISDPVEIRQKHFLDSLAGLPVLREKPGTVADIGSGAGFPGLVLAAVEPALAVRSIESRSKKTAFQRQIVRDLRLTNAEIVTARVEDVLGDPAPAWITARALASIGELAAMVAPWIDAGSTLVAWKGPGAKGELEAAALSAREVLEIPVAIPGASRSLVLVRKR